MLAGWHCAWLPCCMPRLGYTLVPMPSCSILCWLASHAACPSSWVQRLAHERVPGEGKEGGLVLFIQILNQETFLVFLFITPPKLVLYLVKCTSIKIGLKGSSWSNKNLRITNLQMTQCPPWHCILVSILQIVIIATSHRKRDSFYTELQTQFPFNKMLYQRINSTSWVMSVFSAWITSY